MKIDEKIRRFRVLMKQNNIDVYVIPSSDYHQSEYTTDYFKSREWISGFTGSAGTVVVSMSEMVLFTDGRYFLQAEEELKNTEIKLFKMGEENVPSVEEYINEKLSKGDALGFDGKLFSELQVDKMKNALTSSNIEIKGNIDLFDEIWLDRPSLPKGEVCVHDISFSGKSVEEKLNLIREKMREKNVDYYLLNCLDAIAWTFNIRGEDIPYNPVVLSYALISLDGSKLFINKDKLDEGMNIYLKKSQISVYDYSDVAKELRAIKREESIYFDPSKISNWCYNSIDIGVKKIKGADIVENLKAVKNEVEIENFKNAQKRDGVAMVKFLCWLDKFIGKKEITEITASEKLEQFRMKGKNYVSLSFETIAGYRDHAAIVHYSAKRETDYKLEASGMLLVDSGAQYLDGTTDITRTIVLGDITDEEKRDATLVLKGHIALSMAKFPYGTTGTHLDILARTPLLSEGKNYNHGTGHGIGYLLSVHEGPQRISPYYSKVILKDGMLITNEPGFYKKGKYGIRTENILLVREDYENEFGVFMKFETTTLCPIDLRGIDIELLNTTEKIWLNNYHKEVYESLSPSLSEEECSWLKAHTIEI